VQPYVIELFFCSPACADEYRQHNALDENYNPLPLED
jgi:hypothetical protein